MADRKKTPDVLGSLLNGKKPVKQQASKTASRNNSKTSKQDDSKLSSQQDGSPAKQYASKPASQYDSRMASLKEAAKTKSTFYLSEEANTSLEEGRLHLRKTVPADMRSQVTKSLIVELALQMALEGRGEIEEMLKAYIGKFDKEY